MSPLSPSSSGAHAERPHPMRSLAILGIAALAFALAQTTLIPALSELTTEFGTDASGIAWVISGYLVAAAVLTPVFGRLGDMFGKRRLLVIALVLFAAGSFVSALGTSLEVVVLGRVLQGAGGGIFPLCFGIIRDEFPPERVSTSIGLVSATMGIGGGLGLMLGGLILDHLSYHWIFWLGAIMGVAAAVCAQLFVPESPERRPAKVDLRGAAVLGVGLTLPLLAISRANDWGWGSPGTLGLIAAGLVILAGWIQLQRKTEEPLADIATLASRPVLMTNVATLFVGFGVFASFVLVPQLTQAPESTGYGLGLDATHTGLIMLPAALIMLVAGPVSGILSSRFGSKVPLAAGSLFSTLGLVALGFDHGTGFSILIWNVVASIGVGLAFAAMPNLIVEVVPRHKTGEATGFNTLVRSVGSSLGSQISSAILAGTIVGQALPTDSGFKTAFLVAAGVSALAALLALSIPRSGRSHIPVADEIGAASPLGEPAYSPE